jgi:serine phosphatase RsbU (regulator of sigma subunit)
MELKNSHEEQLFNAKMFTPFIDALMHQWIKTLTFLGITLIPLFGILDYLIAPQEDLVYRFWFYRIINTSIVFCQYLILRFTKPGKYSFLHGYFFSAITNFSIILMTVNLGGFSSTYYQGLNLVIIAVNLLIPWRAIHSAINGLIMLCMYLVLNGIYSGDFEYKILIGNLFFMSSTVIISVAISFLRHKLIKKEFELRDDLAIARDALWGEMEIAKKIQTALLPDPPRMLNYEVSAIMKPADEVGGDYFDLIETADGETWMAIGDVSGHGVESGLIMMMTQTCIHSLVNQSKKLMPSNLLEKLNFVIKENIHRLGANRYMTLTILKLEDDSIYHSGKHQDILIYRAATKTIESIGSFGTWIGVTNNMTRFLKDEKIKIHSGDVIFLYTDGLTEAENAKGELFGIEKVMDILTANIHLPVKAIIDDIIKQVESFQEKQTDDITILACRKL